MRTFKEFVEAARDRLDMADLPSTELGQSGGGGTGPRDMSWYDVGDRSGSGHLKPTPNQHQAPYAVGWSAQSHEWYGDEGPESKEGRYKPKGDGGEIVAINVPTYEKAVEIQKDIELAAKSGQIKGLNAKWGKDWSLLDWHGSWIKSMKEIEEWEVRQNTLDMSKSEFNPRTYPWY